MHFAIPSFSWPGMVERFARELPDRCVRRAVFRGAAGLQRALHDRVAGHNHDPKPLVRTAKAPDMVERAQRARAAE